MSCPRLCMVCMHVTCVTCVICLARLMHVAWVVCVTYFGMMCFTCVTCVTSGPQGLDPQPNFKVCCEPTTSVDVCVDCEWWWWWGEIIGLGASLRVTALLGSVLVQDLVQRPCMHRIYACMHPTDPPAHALRPQVFAGDVVPKKKPDPAIYLLAAEKLGVDPKKCEKGGLCRYRSRSPPSFLSPFFLVPGPPFPHPPLVPVVPLLLVPGPGPGRHSVPSCSLLPPRPSPSPRSLHTLSFRDG